MRCLFFIITILYSSAIFTQNLEYHVSSVNPEVEVLSINMDTLGFLWIHDEQILYRFDGLEYVPKLTLQDDFITSVFSHHTQFVIGTSEGRLMSFNPYNCELVVIKERTDNQQITGIHFTDANNYLALSYGNGIKVVTNGNLNTYDYDTGLISNEVYDVAYYNRKYYISTDQGIQVFNSVNGKPSNKFFSMTDGLSDIVTIYLEVHQNHLWYTDYNQHLGYLDSFNHITNYSLPVTSKINNLSSYQNSLYISTDDGLYEFFNETFRKLLPKEGKIKVKVSQVDEEGNLWFFTGEKKLYRGSIYFEKLNTPFNNIRAINIFQDRLVVGNEEGLFIEDSTAFIPISKDNITHLFTLDNYLLVGTFSQGIKVYDSSFKQVFSIDSWLNINHQSVLHIYSYKDKVYVSSLSGVMQFSFDDGVLIPLQSLNLTIGSEYIYSIEADSDKLYLGTDRNGLITWDISTGKVRQIKRFESGERIGSIYAMTFDVNHDLWFTSKKEGIGVLKSGIPYKLTNHLNTTADYTSLATLNSGNLLAIHRTSIDLIDTKNNRFIYFEQDTGLEENISFLNTIAQINDETYFVHNQTIYSYKPHSHIKVHPEVIIDNVFVNLAQVKQKSLFSEDENNVEFNFSGSWLKDPSNLMYQYRLVGFDPEWRTTKDRSVAFPKLNPGKYEFQLKVSENTFFQDESKAIYPFEIKRHFYNTWWMKLFGLCLLAFIGWKISRIQEVRKKERLEHEKLNIENQLINLKNQLNPHFLFNAFNTLVGLIEEDQDQSIIFVERITDFYRNILEYGEQNLITLAKEKVILEQYVDILKARFNGQLDIQLDISEGLEKFTIPPMTLQLLVENAVKHNVVSTKNPLRINIYQVGDQLTVRNDKKPLMSDNSGTKTGLKNIKKRFKLVELPEPKISNTSSYFEIILHLKSNG